MPSESGPRVSNGTVANSRNTDQTGPTLGRSSGSRSRERSIWCRPPLSIADWNEGGHSTTSLRVASFCKGISRNSLEPAPRQEDLGQLDRIRRGPLAQVVGDHPES